MMDHEHVAALLRRLRVARSRRGLLAGGSTGLMALLIATRDGQDALASRTRDTHAAAKKRHKKHKKKQSQTVPPPPASPPPPSSSPPPPATGPGFCGFAGAAVVALGGRRRIAQTFLPPRSGQLMAAQIYLAANPANFSLTFEIRTVDAAGVPTSTILASTVVRGLPATTPGTLQPIPIVFATPATITLGQPLALTITADSTDYLTLANPSGNPCPDGTYFTDQDATGTFETSFGAGADLVYAVTIV
jgi:hypothetical protein